MARLSVRLLGPFQASLDGQPLSGFRSDKVRALLAFLCVEWERPWPRAGLAELLWSDFPEKNALSNLRNALSNLRGLLDDGQTDAPFLRVSRATVQFNSEGDAWIDVHAFLDRLTEGRQGAHPLSGHEGISRLQRTLDLYRGDFLEGLRVDSAPFEEWMLGTGEGLRQKAVATVRLLAVAHAALGDLSSSASVTRRWLELEPWDEAAHRHMMRVLTLRGRRSAALAHFEGWCQTLEKELGAAPESETVHLYEQLRNSTTHLASEVLPQTAEWPSLEGPPSHTLPLYSTLGTPSAEESPLFVDREQELERLASALSGAAAGRGGVIFLIGEPGSGKTALLAECARRALADYPALLLGWGQCNAFTGQGDPYFPFLSISRMLIGQGEASMLTGVVCRELAQRVWRSLPESVDALVDRGPDLIGRFISGKELLHTARLHGGVESDRLATLQALVEQSAPRSPQGRVRQTALFEQFVSALSTLAQRRPLLLIVDDAQWIDPGSVELLFHLARQTAGRKILLLGAYRPQDSSLHRGEDPHPLLGVVGELQRGFGDIFIDLMESEAAAFVEAVIDSEPNELDDSFRALLHRQTAGNPLFTIELLRAMQLRGEIRRGTHGRWVEGPQLNWDELPARVEAVIGRRIDHLSPACQEVLRAASVEGEQFTAEVVAGTLEKDVQYVCDLLSREAGRQHRLVTAESVRQIDGQTLSVYRFRHALFQIYLYHHLDVVERARLHGLVGEHVERLYGDTLDRFPHVIHALARHFEAAGRVEKAIRYYTRAGKNAVRLSANEEALAHFYKALDLLETLPPTPDRDRQELDLQLSLGAPLTATKGWAPPEMAAAYGRAQELLGTIEDHAQLIPALWLLATYRLGRSEHAEVDRLVERLYRLARQAGDPTLLALAQLQASPFYQGKFVLARASLERASTAPDVEQQRQLALQYGMAPAVVGRAYLAVCLWLLGLPDQAEDRMREAQELAERVAHPMGICYALSRACWLAAPEEDLPDVRRRASTLDEVAQEFQIENFVLAARFFTHWAAVQRGESDQERLGEMQQAIDAYRATGTVLNRTAFLTLFAEACATAREIARGLAAVEESLTLGEETGELWFQAEALRMKGELLSLLSATEADPDQTLSAAEASLEQARRTAAEQGAKSFELRATVSLCRFWQSQSPEGKDHEILVRILETFDEDVDTIDIRRAKALLGSP